MSEGADVPATSVLPLPCFGPLDGSAAPQLPGTPSRRRRRPKPPPTAYGRTPGTKVDLPPGHIAQLIPIGSSTGFIGDSFSMDSLEFMRWAAKRYDEDRFVLVVLLTLMGSQKPGGQIEATHEDVAKALGYSRPHISRVFNVLEADGALRKVKRGLYQLNPAASLRGGFHEPRKGEKRSKPSIGDRVEQLDLLREIMEDPNAPEAFRAMAAPGAKLEVPKGSRGREGQVMTSAAEEWAPRRVLWGSFNGLAYVPRLPPTAYTLLLHMMSEQEAGGLVVATHDELATGLALERGMISRAMPHLVAARLVTVVRRGRFQLHPAISAFADPRDQQRAMRALPRDLRLDVGDFEDEYERRFQLHLDEKARKAAARGKGNVRRSSPPRSSQSGNHVSERFGAAPSGGAEPVCRTPIRQRPFGVSEGRGGPDDPGLLALQNAIAVVLSVMPGP